MELKNKRVLVVGLGKSGEESARFLHDQGARVSVSESAKKEDIPQPVLSWIEENKIALEAGGHKLETFLETELIVVSPGVPLDIAPLAAARRAGIPVTGEIELAACFITRPILAVTGTNGKSTTTSMIGHILSSSGRSVFVGGNIGRPLIGYVSGGQRDDFVVAEISSFQLDTTKFFRPKLALLLNITEDHLDRYPSFAHYAASKFSIFSNQTSEDAAILNRDDPVVMQGADSISAQVATFGHSDSFSRGAYVRGKELICRLFDGEEVYSLEKLTLAGEHNLENTMAAVLAARLSGCEPSSVQEALATFKGLHHRTEFVCEIGGVRFYDDSK
ncbi:MAG: UDP-N-acetylmuramoyl-L-alanine--D-glutamate ligase [Pseudomonadota bacterium]